MVTLVGMLTRKGLAVVWSRDGAVIRPSISMLRPFVRRRDITIAVAVSEGAVAEAQDEATAVMCTALRLNPDEPDNLSVNPRHGSLSGFHQTW